MNKIKFFLIILILLCIQHFSSSAIDIVKAKKNEIELCLLFAPACSFYYPSFVTSFYFKSLEIDILGNYDDRIIYVINFDFSELENEDESFSTEFIQNAYVQYKFYKQFKIRIGQFKVPFGDEIFSGISERPYLDHSLGSKKLGPGRNLGCMIFGNNLFSFFFYRMGIFNTSDVVVSENETSYISTAGKLFLEIENSKRISLKTGYSLYYSFEEIFSQSIFFSFVCTIDDIKKFILFSEYIEERLFHYHWNNSIFLFTSYRQKNFEIYCTGDLFDENSGIADKDDCFKLNSGINVYWMKDRLRIGLEYAFIYNYQLEENSKEQQGSIMLLWKI